MILIIGMHNYGILENKMKKKVIRLEVWFRFTPIIGQIKKTFVIMYLQRRVKVAHHLNLVL